ncbi:MAG: hypothetical protein U9Q82_06045, partial [Chloroflexota bacterium]|nr:hypothetical protein [Chloroflexota bacterium]
MVATWKTLPTFSAKPKHTFEGYTAERIIIVIEKEPKNGRRRSRIGIGFVVIGFLVFLLGIEPEIFALDRS